MVFKSEISPSQRLEDVSTFLESENILAEAILNSWCWVGLKLIAQRYYVTMVQSTNNTT